MNVDYLKIKIDAIIKDDEYDINDIVNIIDPAFSFIKDELFVTNIRQVVSIITMDRDGNGKFTIKDLELLSKDPLAMTTLGTSVMLMIKVIPNLKAQFDRGALEELLFKISAYVFLVAIPKQINHKWTAEEKNKIVNIVMTIYTYVKTSDITVKIINKIKIWFQNKGWRKIFSCCKCCKKDPKIIATQKMSDVNVRLDVIMKNIRDKADMQHQISELQLKIMK